MELTTLAARFRDDDQRARAQHVIALRLADDRVQEECRYLMRFRWQLAVDYRELTYGELQTNLSPKKLAIVDRLLNALVTSRDDVDLWIQDCERDLPIIEDQGTATYGLPMNGLNPSTDDYARWEDDARTLAELGAVLSGQPTLVSVSIPRRLAEDAVAAWNRDEPEGTPSANETPAQRSARHQAASLALIGSCISESGVFDEVSVRVSLPAWFVGDALSAADQLGLLHQPLNGPTPDSSTPPP